MRMARRIAPLSGIQNPPKNYQEENPKIVQLTGVVDEDLIGYRTGGGDHWEIAILPEGLCQGVYEAGVEKRFVALDV